jgi:hypothetical protein
MYPPFPGSGHWAVDFRRPLCADFVAKVGSGRWVVGYLVSVDGL